MYLYDNKQKENNKMAREAMYSIGKKIGDKWIIVAILEKRGCNKKIICYNAQNGIFKEGWIWDFTRNLVSDKPNRNPSCKICEYTFTDLPRNELYDCNSDYAFNQAIRTKNLTSNDVVVLRNIREGTYCNFNKVLKKFSDMLAKSGQHRRNSGLATVIGTTYEILNRKGVI